MYIKSSDHEIMQDIGVENTNIAVEIRNGNAEYCRFRNTELSMEVWTELDLKVYWL